MLDEFENPPEKRIAAEGSASEALDRLNENNRFLEEARMLPRDQKLTLSHYTAVCEHFKRYIQERDIPLAKVADQINYSASVVSQWQSNTYRGDADRVTHAINDWMERDARRASSRMPRSCVPTRFVANAAAAIAQADRRSKMLVIVAPSGAGKTMVAKERAEALRGVYICIDETKKGGHFLRALGLAIGRSFSNTSNAVMMQWIVEQLQGTHRVIFIDEAHQCTRQTLNFLRSIHDSTECPIVMLGSAEILDHINDRSDGRGQFSSRCLYYNALDDLRSADAPGGGSAAGTADLFTVQEVRAFLDSKKMRLADDALSLLWAIACLPNHGTLRTVETVADTVRDMKPGIGLVTRRDVLLALQLMLGRQSVHVQRLAQSHLELAHAAVA